MHPTDPALLAGAAVFVLSLLLRSSSRLGHTYLRTWYVRELITVTVPWTSGAFLAMFGFAVWLPEWGKDIDSFSLLLPSLLLLSPLWAWMTGITLSPWLGPRWLRRLHHLDRHNPPPEHVPTRTTTVHTPNGTLTFHRPHHWTPTLIHPHTHYTATSPSLHGTTPTTLTITTPTATDRDTGTLIHTQPVTIDTHPTTHTLHTTPTTTTYTWTIHHGPTITLTTPTTDTPLNHTLIHHLIHTTTLITAGEQR